MNDFRCDVDSVLLGYQAVERATVVVDHSRDGGDETKEPLGIPPLQACLSVD